MISDVSVSVQCPEELQSVFGTEIPVFHKKEGSTIKFEFSQTTYFLAYAFGFKICYTEEVV